MKSIFSVDMELVSDFLIYEKLYFLIKNGGG